MPTPHKGEPISEFVHRFVGSKEAERSFPKKKQRLAVAYSEARAKAKRK
jgi:hypothetical protein